MAQAPLPNGRAKAFYLVLLQAAAVLLIAAIFGWVKGIHAAYSAFLGGLICVIANGYFALKVFSFTRSSAPKRIWSNFYKGEITKLLITVMLIILAIKYGHVLALPFFITYIAAHFVMWLGLLNIKKLVVK